MCACERKKGEGGGWLAILPWLLIAAYVVFIFSNSLLSGEASGSVSGSISKFLYSIVQKLGFSMSDEKFHHLVRKLAHFTEFAGLGILVRIATGRMVGRGKWLLRGMLLIAVPLIDETIQLFVPGRGGSLRDCCIDMAGYVTGFLLAAFVAWLVRNVSASKKNGEE